MTRSQRLSRPLPVTGSPVLVSCRFGRPVAPTGCDRAQYRRSAFAATEGEPCDELPLQSQVDDQRRHQRDRGPGGDEVVVAEELALQVVDRGGDGQPVTALDQ